MTSPSIKIPMPSKAELAAVQQRISRMTPKQRRRYERELERELDKHAAAFEETDRI